MDDLIAASGQAYRALTNPYFMEDAVRQAESIKDRGVFFWPIGGDRKLPTVATRDIAAAASRLLLDPSWSGVEEVPLLGPEDLSFNDMAQIMSQVLGKDVRFLVSETQRRRRHSGTCHSILRCAVPQHERSDNLLIGSSRAA